MDCSYLTFCHSLANVGRRSPKGSRFVTVATITSHSTAASCRLPHAYASPAQVLPTKCYLVPGTARELDAAELQSKLVTLEREP